MKPKTQSADGYRAPIAEAAKPFSVKEIAGAYMVVDADGFPVTQVISKYDATLVANSSDLLEALKGLTRIVEAVGYTTQLGVTQKERFAVAKAVISRLEVR